MSYGRHLTLSCDWPTGLDLNAGAPPSEGRAVYAPWARGLSGFTPLQKSCEVIGA